MSEATAARALFVGVDPAKRTFAAYAVDQAGGGVAAAHFPRSQRGNEALWAWAAAHGDVIRWGVEGAASWGRHIALYLVGRGGEVREVCPNRTGRADRACTRVCVSGGSTTTAALGVSPWGLGGPFCDHNDGVIGEPAAGV
jgi:hypothetical protein